MVNFLNTQVSAYNKFHLKSTLGKENKAPFKGMNNARQRLVAQKTLTFGISQQKKRPHIKEDNLRGISLAGCQNITGSTSPRDIDLTTKQSDRADNNALSTATLLIASQARDERQIIENPKELMTGLLTSIIETVQALDPESEEAAKALNYLASQLGKSWSPKKGGVGCFKASDNLQDSSSSSTTNTQQAWKPEWDGLAKAFAPNKSTNEENKQQLIAMCRYFQDQTESHFSETNHPMVNRVNQIQLVGTIGQVMEDFLANNTPSSQKLFERMVNNKVLDGESYQLIDTIRQRCRANNLLSEVGNKQILEAVVKEFKSENNANKIKALIKKEISKGSLDNRSYDALIDKVYDRFVEKIGNVKPKTFISGERGRGKGAFRHSMLNLVNGSEGVTHYPISMPNGEKDKLAIEAIRSVFSGDQKMEQTLEALDDGALHSDYIPKTIIRLNSGLSSALKRNIYDQPAKLISQAAKEIAEEIAAPINAAIEEDNRKRDDMFHRKMSRGKNEQARRSRELEKARVLTEFTIRSSSPELTRRRGERRRAAPIDIKEVVGTFKVPYNSKHDRTITLKEFVENKSVAGLIAKHHLRTFCGPSGTTLDTIFGLMTQKGVDEIKKIANPLFTHVKSLKEPQNDTTTPFKDADSFKTFFSSLSIQMQGGQYHSAAEVLGGIYIVAMALQESGDDEYFNLQQALEDADLLMQDFSEAPGKYFPVEAKDIELTEQVYSEFKDSDEQFEFSSSSSSSDDE
jgi:hypothetical protein